MKYYFAYGSNMNFKQMKDRCPSSKFLRRAYLEGYKFIYDGFSSTRKCAVANIIRAECEIIWGALFEVDDKCMESLDEYEGYPNSYQNKLLEVKDNLGNSYKASVYLREPREFGKPSDEYRNFVLEGANECGLPKEYIIKFIMV